MKTLVHKNLHNGLWAITQSGKVVGYADEIVLSGVDLKWDAKKAAFSQSGNKRTVHCWARGDLVSVTGFQSFKGRELATEFDVGDFDWSSCAKQQVRYNPKRENCMMVGDIEYFGSPYAIFAGESKMFAILG